MIFRRVAYGLTLAGVLLFQITNENYFAHFLLALCIALPLVSLALSLPGMTGCRLELSAAPAAPERGEAAVWQVSASVRGGLPLARLSLRLTAKNLLTDQRESWRLVLTGVARRRPVELPAGCGHCGLLELRVSGARVYDLLGLFSLPAAAPEPARLLCRPVPAAVELPVFPEGSGVRTSPLNAVRPGPGEDCDLRDYRPGDPMRSVHWKLSSKWDKLIVRERAETPTPLPVLTLDRFGPPEELDRLLDRLLGLSQGLLSVQRPHNVLWLDAGGEPRLRPVSDERELTACLVELLGTAAPPSGPRLDDRPELTRDLAFRIHVTLEGGGGDG